MPFAAALSTQANTAKAVEEVCGEVLARVGPGAHLACVFFSPHHASTLAWAERLAARLDTPSLIGCQGESIVGNDREIEDGPGLALWLAKWSQPVEIRPFHLHLEETPDGYSLLGWPDELAGADPTKSVVLLLADPFTFPVDAFLRQLQAEHPGLRVMGGMGSGGDGPGRCPLLQGATVHDHGGVGVLLRGPIGVRSVVSQGCRPIGRPFVITKAKDNLIYELGGKPIEEQLDAFWHSLSPADQELLRQGLHLGRVINEYQSEFQRGDFLVRNVIGFDRSSGALAITDRVRVGQTVQFHVRDANTADEDLHALLQQDHGAHPRRPEAALLFTCNGRGTRLFPAPHHDARVVRAETGGIPLAGFFAQGELGPVGGQNFIHGFTASVVLFEDA